MQFLKLGASHMPARSCPHCGWTIKYASKRCQRCVKPLPKELQEGLPEPPPPPAPAASAPVQHAPQSSVNAKTARHPLMGALQWNEKEQRWQGEIQLPLPYTDHASGLETDLYDLLVYDKAGEKPSPAQERAFAYLQENRATICQAVRTWVFKYVQYVREGYHEPTLHSPDELVTELSSGDVSLLATSKDECAFVLFGFECKIDAEHGIDVVVHKNTILGIGSRHVGILLDAHGFDRVPPQGWGFEALEDIV